MQDGSKLWSCAGSAGVVSVGDIVKVDFVGSIVRLHGFDVVIHPTAHTSEKGIQFIETKAVIRYGVTPVDGLTLLGINNHYALGVYFRAGNGHVQARLIQVAIPPVDVPAPVKETVLITFTSANEASFVFKKQGPPTVGMKELDFVNNSYYVEVTLSQSTNPVLPPTNPPEVALVQIAPDVFIT